MASKKYEVPTWNKIYGMLLNQAQKITKANYMPDLIVAISRGGLVPARILSDLLQAPTLATIGVTFYIGINQKKEQPTINQSLSMSVTEKRVLIVDDISDTGSSLKLVTQHILKQGAKEVKTATLYIKPSSTFTPDFFEKQTNSWVIYPWDAKETLRKTFEMQDTQAVNLEIDQIVKAGLPKRLVEKLLADLVQEQKDDAVF